LPDVLSPRWGAVVCISVALHALALFGFHATLPRSLGEYVAGPSLKLRIVGVDPSPSPGSQSIEVGAFRPPEREQPMPVTSEASGTSVRQQPPARKAAPVPPSSFSTGTLPVPRGFDEDDYLPSSRLTTKPSPIGEISIPYPDGFDPQSVRNAILTVFIDEDGVVARVRVDRSELPVTILNKGKETFENARFHPGRIDGVAVKSRMKVEMLLERVPGAPDKTPIPKPIDIQKRPSGDSANVERGG
jgi:hypothetical protein